MPAQALAASHDALLPLSPLGGLGEGCDDRVEGGRRRGRGMLPITELSWEERKGVQRGNENLGTQKKIAAKNNSSISGKRK